MLKWCYNHFGVVSPNHTLYKVYEAEMEGRREEGGQGENGTIILSNDTVTHVITVLNGRVPHEIQSHMAHEGKCLFLPVRLSVTQSVIVQNH